MDFQMRLEPHVGVEEEVHVLDSDVAGNPRAIDDHRHRNVVEALAAGGAFKGVPLFWSHVF